jgi:two-component sensor histidine kinase
MPFGKSRVYLLVIYILLAAIGVVLLSSVVLLVGSQREIERNNVFLGENFLAHTQSLNRIVFSLHRLLSYDETEAEPDTLVDEKTELCRQIVSSTRYIANLPDLEIDALFKRDPLLLSERIRESRLSFQRFLADLSLCYGLIEDAADNETRIRRIDDFGLLAAEFMESLEAHNFLMVQFDDYLFSHLQGSLEEVTEILRLYIIFHAFLMSILIAVSVLYFLFVRKANLELIHSRDSLEETVTLRTRDLVQSREELQTLLGEREFLLKEIHHRVKNNLSVVNSILMLRVDSHTDPELSGILFDISNRIHSISLVHEKIYASASLSRIDFEEYVRDLSASIIGILSKGEIRTEISMVPAALDSEQVIPLGMIITELMTNAIKYGFENSSGGVISLNLESEEGFLILKVHNDGHPLPEGFSLEETSSLGLQIVGALVSQLQGSVELREEGGPLFVIRFPAGVV